MIKQQLLWSEAAPNRYGRTPAEARKLAGAAHDAPVSYLLNRRLGAAILYFIANRPASDDEDVE